jgi:hypothetical protein
MLQTNLDTLLFCTNLRHSKLLQVFNSDPGKQRKQRFMGQQHLKAKMCQVHFGILFLFSED